MRSDIWESSVYKEHGFEIGDFGDCGVEDRFELWPLIPNPFHVLQENLLPAAVIEFRRSAVGVAGDSLSGFQGAVIFQKIRDPGRPERVRRIVSRQPRLFEPALEHIRGVRAYERPAR